MNKNKSKKKLRGTVLYTVVAVMMVMTVLIFAALTLAVSANRRAYNSYANNQTQYTARSVIEGICEAMNSDTSFMKQFISLEAAGQTIDVTVELPDKDKSMGTLVGNKATVTCLGSAKEYGYDTERNMYKVTATVKLAGQENSVSGYFLAERSDISLPFSYALVALESGGGANNLKAMGGVSIGVNQEHDLYVSNDDPVFSSPVNVNGNLTISDNRAYVKLNKFNEGLYVAKKLTLINGGTPIRSESPLLEDKKVNYKNLQYSYIGDNVEIGGWNTRLASQENPVIFMMDSISCLGTTNNYQIWGDLYLYGKDSTSDIAINQYNEVEEHTDGTHIDKNYSGINPWTSDLINKKDNASTDKSSYKGGNLYSLGTVNVNAGAPENPYNLANNVVVDKINLNASATTTGAVVANSINFQNSSINSSFEDGLFVAPENFWHTEQNDLLKNVHDFTVNNQIYSSPEIGIIENYLFSQEYTSSKQYSYTDGETVYTEKMNILEEWRRNSWNTKAVYLDCFDYTSHIPENADKVSVEILSIDVDTSKIQGVDYISDNVLFVCDFIGYDNNLIPFKTGSWMSGTKSIDGKITFDLTDSGYVFDAVDGYAKNGIGLTFRFAPKDDVDNWWNNNDKEIILNSVSLNVKVTAYENEDIILSETDNAEFLRSVNDVAFEKNNGTIYIDDIDKSVKLEKFIDADGYTKLRVSKADLTAIEEGKENEAEYTEIGLYYYDDLSSYADFLRTVVSTVTFPDSMKKVEKSGTNPDADPVFAPEMVNVSFIEWDSYEIKSTNQVIPISKQELEAKLKIDKAFEHIRETEGLVYTFSGSNVSWEDTDGNIVTKNVNEVEFNSSCTFKGELHSPIRITPSAKNIYIKLDGFGCYNLQNQVAITVDDNGGENRVNFLIESGKSFSTNGAIMTDTYCKMYSEEWKDDSGSVIKPLNKFLIDQNNLKQEYIPGIVFYMEYDKASTSEISTSNNALITGYIMAPTATCNLYDPLGAEYTYTTNELYIKLDINGDIVKDENGKPVIESKTLSEATKTGVVIIGGVLAKNTSFNANNSGCLYVNPNSILELEEEKGLRLSDYECVYYQAN